METIHRPAMLERKIAFRFQFSETICRLGFQIEDSVFWSLAALVFVYAVLNAYQIMPSFLADPIRNVPIAPLSYLVLRYHIAIVLILSGFFTFITRKHSLRTMIALAILVVATYLGLMAETALQAPIIIVAIALPALSLLVNSKKKVATTLILSLIFLGVFSGCFYSATVKSMEPDYPNLYEDLPHVLQILMSQNPNTKVYTISSYDYFVNRVVWSMATLKTSSDPSCPIYIIDTRYTQRAKIESLLNDNHSRVLYQGQALILLERTK